MSLVRRALPVVPIALVACGGRSGLASSAGSTATGGAPSTSTSSAQGGTGGAPAACTAWQIVEPVVELPTAAPAVRAPEPSLADDDQDVYVTIVEAAPGAAGALVTERLHAFGAWPPELVDTIDEASNVRDYVTGEGATGPVGILADGSGQLHLATSLLPAAASMPQATPGNTPLFVTGLADRWLYGASQTVTGYTKVDVGSYQTGSLEQSEAPAACLAAPALGAAVPAGQGFVAAYGLPNPPGNPCDFEDALPPTIVTFYRYDAPAEPGTFLTDTEADHLVFGEPLAKVVLSRTSDGAWAFAQTDGSTALQPPAVVAARVDRHGHLAPVGATDFPATPDGAATGPIAAASLGDGAALAWTSTTDPSAPTISVRTVTPGGDLGPITTFPTTPIWLTARLRVVASRSLRSLLVAWEGGTGATTVGLARLDCAPAADRPAGAAACWAALPFISYGERYPVSLRSALSNVATYVHPAARPCSRMT